MGYEPRFTHLGGINQVVEELNRDYILQLSRLEEFQRLKVRPRSKILLSGPVGCGKTMLAYAIAAESRLPIHVISATNLVFDSAQVDIPNLFSKAIKNAPSIVLIEDIDVLAPPREELQSHLGSLRLNQLKASIEESISAPGYVMVIAATSFPDVSARFGILSVLLRDLKLKGDVDISRLAKCTPGFVGADLAGLVRKAGMLAMSRTLEGRDSELSNEEMSCEFIESQSVTMVDFEKALENVVPFVKVTNSFRVERFDSISMVKWEDVVGLHSVKEHFERNVIKPIKNLEIYKEIEFLFGEGVLLHGPQGCGKTFIAKAVASAAGPNFIHVKAHELMKENAGESEVAVQTIFSCARGCSPCIVFFDEMDCLTMERGKESRWVVNQLLTELDGAKPQHGVYVIGAMNRPEVIDPALLRSGRLGKRFEVPPPSPEERGLILKVLAKKYQKYDAAVDLDLVALGKHDSCNEFTGADLAVLMAEAVLNAKGDDSVRLAGALLTIKAKHFEDALESVRLSLPRIALRAIREAQQPVQGK